MGCGGGDVNIPGPTPQELAIQDLTYKGLMQQQRYYAAMEPYILQQMGFKKTTQGESQEYKDWLTARDAWVAERLPLGSTKAEWEAAYQNHISAAPEQYSYAFEKMSDDEYYNSLSSLDKAQYDAAKLQADQYSKALRGELPLSQAVENELAKQKANLESYMSRKLGPNWQQSTPGIQALAEFDKQANALREEQMFGKQTGASAMNIAQQQALMQQLQRGMSNQSAFPAYNSGIFGLASSVLQPYQAQRQMQFQANQYNAQNEAGMLGAFGSLLGTGLSSYMGYLGMKGFGKG